MNVLKPISRSKIPNRSAGGGRKSDQTEAYNEIVDKVVALKDDSVLPIECTDLHECVNVSMALKGRNIHTIRRGTTLFATVKEEKG